jgi:hypothetical protein
VERDAAPRDHQRVEQLPARQVRALYDAETITVYQAYSAQIAFPAVRAGKFVPPFKRDRMTWIKPSFRWMMYRCGYATKPDQERVLAVQITRAGFEWALAHSCLSQYDRDFFESREEWSHALAASSVRVQWDPERSVELNPLPYRSLQVGLSPEVVERYIGEWTVDITDVTHVARNIGERVRAGKLDAAALLLPAERPYPLPEPIAVSLRISR